MSGRFILTNRQESFFLTFLKQIHMFFSKTENLQHSRYSTSIIYIQVLHWKRWICHCKILFLALNQHQVATCYNYMNRKIPMPTSHNKRNWSFLDCLLCSSYSCVGRGVEKVQSYFLLLCGRILDLTLTFSSFSSCRQRRFQNSPPKLKFGKQN